MTGVFLKYVTPPSVNRSAIKLRFSTEQKLHWENWSRIPQLFWLSPNRREKDGGKNKLQESRLCFLFGNINKWREEEGKRLLCFKMARPALHRLRPRETGPWNVFHLQSCWLNWFQTVGGFMSSCRTNLKLYFSCSLSLLSLLSQLTGTEAVHVSVSSLQITDHNSLAASSESSPWISFYYLILKTVQPHVEVWRNSLRRRIDKRRGGLKSGDVLPPDV